MKKFFLVILLISFCSFTGSALQTGQKATRLKIGKWLKTALSYYELAKKYQKTSKKTYLYLFFGAHGHQPAGIQSQCLFICKTNTAPRG